VRKGGKCGRNETGKGTKVQYGWKEGTEGRKSEGGYGRVESAEGMKGGEGTKGREQRKWCWCSDMLTVRKMLTKIIPLS
jgi:hypothetical protein